MRKQPLIPWVFAALLATPSIDAQAHVAQTLCDQLKKLPNPFSQVGVLHAGKAYQQLTLYVTYAALGDTTLNKKVCDSYSVPERSECLTGPMSFNNELIGMKNLLINPRQPGAEEMIPETFGQVSFNLGHYLQTQCQSSIRIND